MQGIRKSWKAGILSAAIAAAVCGLFWVALDNVGELAFVRPIIDMNDNLFWLSLFLLVSLGTYLSITPPEIDEP